MAPGRDRLPARRQGAAASGAPVRGCGQPAARTRPGRPCCGRSTSTPMARPPRCGWSARSVRSRAKLDYVGVQAAAGAGALDEPIALLPEIGALLHRARARPGRHQPTHPRAGGRARRRRLAAGAARGRYRPRMERADLAADRHGAPPTSCSPAGSGCCARCPPPRPEAVDRAARGRRRPRHGLAGRRQRRAGARLASTRPTRAAPRSSTRPPSSCAAPATPRSTARPPEPTGHGGVGRAVRARDRAAAPPGRPVRDRGLPGLSRRPGRAGLGARGAAAAARGDGEVRPPGVRRRTGCDRARRGGAAGATGWARSSTPSCSTSTPARTNATVRPGPPVGAIAIDEPPVRARCEGDLTMGERIRVRLVQADPAQPHSAVRDPVGGGSSRVRSRYYRRASAVRPSSAWSLR